MTTKKKTNAPDVTPAPEPPASDSGGIIPGTGDVATAPAVVMVKLAELAPHPHNPRHQLGDLTGLTESIKAQGVLEPLVVLTAEAFTKAAEADGDPERPGEGIRYVNMMGHRRAPAAAAAGLAEVPAVIRDDLAGQEARAQMIAENLWRESLTPLEEAEQMADLVARGWSQRRIAEAIGCGQAHVSKRLSLLQLPESVREKLGDAKLTVADGLELHKLYGSGRDEIADAVISEAAASIGQGYSPEMAIRQAKNNLRKARTEQATRGQLQQDGIELVTQARADRLGWRRIYGDRDPHAKAGCLAALIDYDGSPGWLCTNPASHRDTPEARPRDHQAEDRETERETRKAAKAHDSACQRIVAGKMPAGPALLQILTEVVIGRGGGGYADALRVAWRWLRDSGAVHAAATDHYAGRDELTAAGDTKALQRLAYAYALALDELHFRARYHAWGERHIAHLARLTEHAGYEPTAWEQRQLAEAKACVAAKGTLTCPGCGCADDPSCGITYDRQAGQPVYECSWCCDRHRNHDDQADEGGRDEEEQGGASTEDAESSPSV